MTTQTILDDGQSAGSGLGIHLAMTAVSLVVVGAFVLWQAWPDGGQQSDSTTEVVAMSAAAAETQPRGGLAELYADQEMAARPATEWLYIVESEAQARSFDEFQALAAENLGRLSSNSSRVIWFDSDESEARFWQIHGEGDAVRERKGLPRLTVVDLRGPAAIAAPSAEWGALREDGH